ncbi:MAG: ribosomal-processing cysteine protease Prp [Ruminococcus sp.]|nr:ribosomal-processing cysteine protease Prp [Ruminococcus sp.]MBR6623275.1 ribosomal-processing cysteine protease Prp [Ruminococcus sp.]
MIRAEFYEKNGKLSGFRLSGHAGLASRGRDVACAAVSSAVQLAVNLLDEFGCSPDVKVGENVIKCTADCQDDTASRLLYRLKQHFEAVLEEFPNTIKITISEV